jgi:hypothetical protein
MQYIQIEFRFPVTGMTIYSTFSNIHPLQPMQLMSTLGGCGFYSGRWNAYRNSVLNSPVDAVYPDRVSFSCNGNDYLFNIFKYIGSTHCWQCTLMSNLGGCGFYSGRWNAYLNSVLYSPVGEVYPDRVSFPCNGDYYLFYIFKYVICSHCSQCNIRSSFRGHNFYSGCWNAYRNSVLDSPEGVVFPS